MAVALDNLERVLIGLGDNDLDLSVVLLLKLLSQESLEGLEVASLGVRVTADDGGNAVLNETKSLVVAKLTGEVHIGIDTSQNRGSRACTDSHGGDLGLRVLVLLSESDLDMLQSETGLNTLQQLGEGDGLLETHHSAHTGTLLSLDTVDGLADLSRGLILLTQRDHVNQEVIDTSNGSINSSVGAVDGDSSSGESEQRSLLRVGLGDGLEASEDEGVVGHDEAGVVSNGLVDDRGGQIDSQKHIELLLLRLSLQRALQQQAGVVPGRVGESSRVELLNGRDNGLDGTLGRHGCDE